MGEGNESEFILLSLRGLSETGEVIDGMIGAWRSGDAEGYSWKNEVRSARAL